MALAARPIPPAPTDAAIRLVPALAGMLPAGAAAWATRICTRGLAAVEWRIVDALGAPRSDWNTLTDARLTDAAGSPLAVPFLATGDLLRVRAPGNDLVYAQSSRVRLVVPDPQEPSIPPGWVIALHDEFSGARLDRGTWRIVASDAGRDPALVTARSGGLVLQALRDAGGAYRTCSIQAGSSAAGGPSWGDVQVSVRFRVERGAGLGLRVALVPFQAGATWPRLDLVQTPGTEKQALRASDYWPGSPAGIAASYPLDMTGWHVVTVRRVAGRWNLWLDQAEQIVPPAWAETPYRDALTLLLAAEVLPAVDGAPDAGSPALWSGHVDFVTVSAPG